MNQPPNTTEEKSKCCGAEKSSGFISRRSGKYYVGCLKCGEPFTPATPSVCEVDKGKECCKECRDPKSYYVMMACVNDRCKCHSTPTEPKKTVENVCCKLGGFEHKIGLEYKGKVCTCTCHTPIQTGNDEWDWKKELNELCKKYDGQILWSTNSTIKNAFKVLLQKAVEQAKLQLVEDQMAGKIPYYNNIQIQKAVLQERESLLQEIDREMTDIYTGLERGKRLDTFTEGFKEGMHQGIRVGLGIINNKQ